MSKYIKGCHCGVNHSGNDRLATHSPGWVQCQGCGHLYEFEKVRWDLAHPHLTHAHQVVVEPKA